MKKSEQPKASKREDGVDLISDMPDPILLLILSCLPSMEGIIRTNILSKRWRYLWTSVSTVDLYCFEGRRNPGNFKKNKFKEFVYWVLANRSVDLDIFNLYCSNYYGMSTIRRWIHTVVRKNVKQLYLSFYPKEGPDYIELPHCLVTCGSLEVLRMNMDTCGLRFPNFKGFPALRVLDLLCADFLEDHNLVKDFLESCPMLEELILSECSIYKLDCLFISCPKLKKLSISNLDTLCFCADIKISCPNLVDLDLEGLIANNYIFECLDSLNKAEIKPKLTGNTKSVLFPGISNVKSLLIDFSFFCQCIKAARDPSLPNLKILVLKTNMDDFTMNELIQILKYCPKMESLKLTIREEFGGPEDKEIHEGDVKMVEFFEINGEKPKVVMNWEDDKLLEMVLSWGNKAN